MRPNPTFLVLVFSLFGSQSIAQDAERRELVNACVAQRVSLFLQDNAREISADGGVTCPSADFTNFSERRHNRSGEIRLTSPVGWQLCEGTSPRLITVSDNGGAAGNFTITADRTSVSIPVSCSGAGIGGGRRWYNGTIAADICPILSDQERVDIVYECVLLLDQ